MAVIHQRISQLSSSGLMNIESSHKFNRSGDTTYGCIEGVNLTDYQVGVIGDRSIISKIEDKGYATQGFCDIVLRLSLVNIPDPESTSSLCLRYILGAVSSGKVIIPPIKYYIMAAMRHVSQSWIRLNQ